MSLLRIHGSDVVVRQGVVVEYCYQFAASQLRLDFPGRTPGQTETFAGPAVQQLTIVAIQIALRADNHRLAVLLKIPTTLLAALQIKSQAIVTGQIIQCLV